MILHQVLENILQKAHEVNTGVLISDVDTAEMQVNHNAAIVYSIYTVMVKVYLFPRRFLLLP